MTSTVKRAAVRVSTAIGAAAAVVALTAGPALAEVVVRWYPYTTAGAKSCNTAANVAGPEYYCKALKLANGTWVWALARP